MRPADDRPAIPAEARPRWMPSEVLRARQETPELAEKIGRLRARIRKEAYDPTIHHPDALRSGIPGPPELTDAELDEIRRTRAAAWTPSTPRPARPRKRDDAPPPAADYWTDAPEGRPNLKVIR